MILWLVCQKIDKICLMGAVENQSQSPEAEQIYQKISSSPGHIDWKGWGKSKSFSITLPENCFVGGKIIKRDKDTELYISDMGVNNLVKRRGVGKRLFRMALAVGKRQKTNVLCADVMSEEMLMTMASVLGQQNLRFFEIPEDYPDGELVPVPISYLEALANFTGTRVEADIRNLKTSDWELPIKS